MSESGRDHPDMNIQIYPAKITNLQTCELTTNYAVKGLFCGLACYKQQLTDIKICIYKWGVARANI